MLTQAEKDGHKLTDDEIIAFLRLLLPAGAETTNRSLGNLLFALLTHPDQLEALTSDRSLIHQAIEEGLRWETSLIERRSHTQGRHRGVRRRHSGRFERDGVAGGGQP